MTKIVFTCFFLLFKVAIGKYKMARGSPCISIGQQEAGSSPGQGPSLIPTVSRKPVCPWDQANMFVAKWLSSSTASCSEFRC